MNESFPGQLLRARREELGLSPDDVYLKLRIPPQFIEAIEAGTLQVLPGKTYGVGFVKTYCQLLAIDPNPYVDAFLYHTRPASHGLSFVRSVRLAKRPSWVNEVVTWATVVGVLLFAWIAYSVVVRPDPNSHEGAAAADAIELAVPTPLPDRTALHE